MKETGRTPPRGPRLRALLLAALAAAAGGMAGEPAPPRCLAVCYGAATPPACGAGARLAADALAAAGFDRVLCVTPSSAAPDELAAALFRIRIEVQPGDHVVFFYSGPVEALRNAGGDVFRFPGAGPDGDDTPSLRDTAVALAAPPAGSFWAFVEGWPDAGGGVMPREPADRDWRLADDLPPTLRGFGLTVSGGPGERSETDRSAGVFAAAFARAVREAAAAAPGDARPDALAEEIRRRVSAESAHRQEPRIVLLRDAAAVRLPIRPAPTPSSEVRKPAAAAGEGDPSATLAAGRPADAERLALMRLLELEGRTPADPAGEARLVECLVAAAHAQGRIDAALAYAKHALLRATTDAGRIGALNRIGRLLLDRNDPYGAIARHTAALELTRARRETSLPPQELTLAWLGEAQERAAAYDDASISFGRATSLWEESGRPGGDSGAFVNEAMGRSYLRRGNAVFALRHFEQAAAIRHAAPTADPLRMASLRHWIGLSLKALNRPREAAEQYRKEIALLETAPSTDPLALPAACESLGDLLLDDGDGAGARAQYARALEARRRAPPDFGPPPLSIHRKLAESLCALGDFPGALAALEPALKNGAPSDPAEMGRACDVLGRACERRNEWTAALGFHLRALEALIAERGMDSPDTAPLCLRIAGLYARSEDAGRAAEFAQRAIDVGLRARETAAAEALPTEALISGYDLLADATRTMGAHGRAASAFTNAAALRAARLGTNAPAVATALGQAGRCFRLAQAPDAARRTLSEAVRILAVLPDPTNRLEVATLQSELGALGLELGRPADAEEAYLRSFDLRAPLLGTNEVATIESMAGIAEALLAQERFFRARDWLRRAVAPSAAAATADEALPRRVRSLLERADAILGPPPHQGRPLDLDGIALTEHDVASRRLTTATP